MKSFIGGLIVVLLIVSAASAGVFGPPEPLSDQGKVSVDMGYWLDRTGMKQDDDRLGTRSNQYYVQGNYTFLKDWEVYGRLGAADMTVHDRDTEQHFGAGPSAFGTLGFKGVLYRNGNFAFGPFVEGSLYGDHTNVATSQWDTNAGLSAQYKVRAVTFYGGPFAYWRQADSQLALNQQAPADGISDRHHLGGFLGLRVPVVQEKVFLTAEAQMKDRPGVGATISYKF